MNRQAQLLYLQNVRDIEVAIYCLNIKHQEAVQAYKKRLYELQTVSYRELPCRVHHAGHICIIIALGFLAWLWITAYILCRPDGGVIAQAFLCFSLCTVAGIVWKIVSYAYEIHRYRIAKRDILSYNNQEQRRAENNLAKVPALIQNWNQHNAWYKGEMGKLNYLREEFYDMNIIPLPFRNVAAVCYIYDYMATSQEALTTALFDHRIEDGIRRIEEKLDDVISSVGELIYETRCQRQHAERIIDQNNRMLESSRRIEKNTLEAAQYARLSANYNKASAFFAEARYFKMN